jgi:hypothetical protein
VAVPLLFLSYVRGRGCERAENERVRSSREIGGLEILACRMGRKGMRRFAGALRGPAGSRV